MFVAQQEQNKSVWLILKKCDLAVKLLILLTRDYHHQDYNRIPTDLRSIYNFIGGGTTTQGLFVLPVNYIMIGTSLQ